MGQSPDLVAASGGAHQDAIPAKEQSPTRGQCRKAPFPVKPHPKSPAALPTPTLGYSEFKNFAVV